MVGCSCIPPPASLQPRKVYNILVPDVFPNQPPTLGQAITAGVEKKIEKLEEYIQKNPARIAKVSRRLTRRIKHALLSKQFGYVEIAVHAYIRLLAKSAKEDSTFSFTYFSKELVHQPDTVISSLLSYPDTEVKSMGASLLANYIAAQDEVENQRDAMQPLVGTVCTLAKNQGAAGSPKLKVACLSALKEYVALCQKLKVLPTHLEDIEEVVLNNLDLSKGIDTSAPPVESAPGSVSKDASPNDLSRALLQQFKPLLQDIGTVYRVMETLFKYLDQGSKWQQGSMVENLMQLVQRSCADQPFPLFTALMRHSSVRGLATRDRAVIIKLAMKQGSVYSLSAFSMALQELPKALASAAAEQSSGGTGQSSADLAELRAVVHEAVVQLAKEVANASQLCEAISSALKNHVPDSAAAKACLECSLQSVSVLAALPENSRRFAGRVFPAPFLAQMAQVISSWAPDAHADALRILAATLPSCGPHVLDDKQAVSLLSIVQGMAAADTPGTPRDIATMDSISRACIGSKRPEPLLNGARLALDLQHQTARWASNSSAGGNAGAGALWGCGLLMLTNSVLGQLADAGACGALKSLTLEVESAAVSGSIVASSGCLMAASDSFASSKPEAASAAAACLQRTTAKCSESGWPGRVTDALCTGGVLAQHYGTGLRPLLAEPLRPKHTSFAVSAATGTAADSPGAPAAAGSSQAASTTASNPAELTTRMQAMASRGRAASLRRERLNLAHVMDLLGEGADPPETPTNRPGGARAGAANVGAGADDGGADGLGVDDVLAMLTAQPPAGTKAGAGAALGGIPMAELSKQLEEVIG